MPNVLRVLDAGQESLEAQRVRAGLTSRIVGQTEAIDAFVGLIEKYNSRMYDTTRPIGSFLFTGPTGVGKTKLVEALCETLRGDKKCLLKIDCGEFQHSHEVAKLLGSPPGYLGHRETAPLLSTSRILDLMGVQADKYPFGVILFDEIEKSSDALWHLLLGILDKGTLTLGTNERVDLTNTLVLMTSNAGSSEMSSALGFGLGFQPNISINNEEIKHIGEEAAKRKFTTEFINRLDKIIACHALTKDQIRTIATKEIGYLQHDIYVRCTPRVAFTLSEAALEALVDEGYDPKYNARNIKRVIDQRLRLPLSRIVAQGTVSENESVHIDRVDGSFVFGAIPGVASAGA